MYLTLASPWRPYIEIYVKRFDKSLSYGEMLEQVNSSLMEQHAGPGKFLCGLNPHPTPFPRPTTLAPTFAHSSP